MGKAESIEELFHEARKRGTQAEREAYLGEACGSGEVRARVEALLKADADTGFFRSGAPETLEPDVAEVSEGVGTTVGRYKLLQLIGEGGFGLVFMAEQREPVVRRVALKIIKMGMDTRQVIARFEAERQALAMMDHPNIARVIDAGATGTGRPYFVMELVQGEPITKFADERHLSIRERLELFEQVCQAVQHAHGKGIIHRDIKPTNVLVSERDGRYVARVIDFGIAKAVSTRLTDKTLFTDHRGFVGTPAYMSPEQAGAAVDVDTRTDVYSLGVLLYELLTGTTPFEGRELRDAAMGEMQRIIREVDPPAPSTRITQKRDTLAGVAASRRVEPKKLGVLVKGDLDWVVMKALEKDRGRRYATASDLGADVLRHLKDEVVMATPPGRTYRVMKLVKRNKLVVGAAVAVNLAVVAGLAVSSVMFVRERAAKVELVAALEAADRARKAAVEAQAKEQQQRLRAQGNYERARAVVDDVTEIAQKQLADRPEVSEVRRQMLESAARMYEKILTMEGDNPDVIREAVNAYLRASVLRMSVGQGNDAAKQLARALELIDGVLKTSPKDADFLFAKAQCSLRLCSVMTYGVGDLATELRLVGNAREILTRFCELEPNEARFLEARARTTRTAAEAYRMAGRLKEASEASGAALKEFESLAATHKEFHGDLQEDEHLYGASLAALGKYAEAEKYFRRSLASREEMLKADPDNDYPYFMVGQNLGYLGGTIASIGRLDEGIELIRRSVAMYDIPVKRHPQYVQCVRALGYTHELLGVWLRVAGKNEEAHAEYLEAKRIAKGVYERNPNEMACVREYLPILTICEDETICEPELAVVVGKKLVGMAPNVKHYWQWLAAGQLQAGDAKGAVETLRSAREIEPKGLQWSGYVMALALCRMGQQTEAREAFREAEEWMAVNPGRWREPKRFTEPARRAVYEVEKAAR